jgi:HK97 family phage major capsid protein
MHIKTRIAALIGLALHPGVVKHAGYRVGRKDGVDPEALKTALAAALATRDAEIKGLIAKSEEEIAKVGKASAETVAALQKAASEGVAMQERLNGIEQELAQLKSMPGRGEPEAHKSAGTQLVESEDFKDFAAKGKGTAILQLKAVTSVTSATTGTGAAGGAIQPDWLPGIVTPALRPFTIRDLLMPGRTGSNVVRFVRETGFQNMAAMVAEGALKPQSDMKFAQVDTSVKTLAHWLKASKQILADVPMLSSYIDTRLTYGLKYVEETQLLSGDGTGENLLGLIPQATAFDNALRAAGDNKIDTLRKAILQVRIAEYRASGIVLNPIDWADIELTKSTTGEYVWVNVGTGASPQLWRLPVVDTNAVPAGNFLVGAFNMAAQVFDREDANVQVSTEDGDNFVKNMVTIRAEERLALVVYRPESFVYGPFVQST